MEQEHIKPSKEEEENIDGNSSDYDYGEEYEEFPNIEATMMDVARGDYHIEVKARCPNCGTYRSQMRIAKHNKWLQWKCPLCHTATYSTPNCRNDEWRIMKGECKNIMPTIDTHRKNQ